MSKQEPARGAAFEGLFKKALGRKEAEAKERSAREAAQKAAQKTNREREEDKSALDVLERESKKLKNQIDVLKTQNDFLRANQQKAEHAERLAFIKAQKDKEEYLRLLEASKKSPPLQKSDDEGWFSKIGTIDELTWKIMKSRGLGRGEI